MAVVQPSRALLLGWRGGAATAVLGLLGKHPAGRRVLDRLGALYLLDERPGGTAPPTPRTHVLPPQPIRNGSDLRTIVSELRVTQVVELATVGTLDCIAAGAAAGADYLTTSLENWPARTADPHDPSNVTLQAAQVLLPGKRPSVPGSHLVGSGMNPGLVNALVWTGLREFAQRVGVAWAPDPATLAAALDLHAVVLTEVDTTRTSRPVPADVFPMTWSPRLCLLEFKEPEAMLCRDGAARGLGHPPGGAAYEARCGPDLIRGFAVPHDEVLTIGARLPDLEVAYLYRVMPDALELLLQTPERRAEDYDVAALYPPEHREPLHGYDRVGALLCSRRYGELWFGFETSHAAARQFDTNATELQVAAGVLAGWNALGSVAGVHVVDDLDATSYLQPAIEILGSPRVVHDPHAPVRFLAQRRVDLADVGTTTSPPR